MSEHEQTDVPTTKPDSPAQDPERERPSAPEQPDPEPEPAEDADEPEDGSDSA